MLEIDEEGGEGDVRTYTGEGGGEGEGFCINNLRNQYPFFPETLSLFSCLLSKGMARRGEAFLVGRKKIYRLSEGVGQYNLPLLGT